MKTIILARMARCVATPVFARFTADVPPALRAVTPQRGVLTILCLLALALIFMPRFASCQTLFPSPYSFTTIEQKSNPCHFNPKSVAVDTDGNVYFADAHNDVICRMQPSGRITIVAGKFGDSGSADGVGSQARFCNPRGIAIDAADNIFVSDTGNNTIRRITPDGHVTTIAGLAGTVGASDGTGIYARFAYPAGLAVDRLGNIFVADLYNSTIRKVTKHGTVTTIAGRAGMAGSADGHGNAALFNVPISIALDSLDNVYVADTLNNSIRKVAPDGTVTTVAGTLCYTTGNKDGVGASARFCHPCGVAVDKAGNIYVADSGNETLRCITPNGAVTTVAGLAGQTGFVNGSGSEVRFWHPTALAFDQFGNLYVTDLDNTSIRKGSALAITTNTNPALSLKTSGTPKIIYSE